MLVLGDAHAEEPERRDALRAVYDAVDPEATLQVGDLGWYDLPAPTWFVAGNNEDLDVIDALRAGESPLEVRNAHLLAGTAAEVSARGGHGGAAEVEGLRVAGLSGNFAPTQYDKPREELVGDRRRHFTHEDVERVAALGDVDVLLTHEAPTGLLSYGYDPGCEHVDDLLDATSPDLCLVGHHHRHREADLRGARVVSLAPAWERYYLLDPADLTLESHETPA